MNTYKVPEIKFDSRSTDIVFLDKSFILLDPSVPFTAELRKLLDKWNFTTVYSNGVFRTATIEEDNDDDEDEIRPISILDKVLENANRAVENAGDDEDERLKIAKSVYDTYLNYITAVYTRYATHNTFDKDDIFAAMQDLVAYVKANKKYMLRITVPSNLSPKDYIVIHSMRSTIIAITIGFELRMTQGRLTELAVSCLLHEIGMLRLPPQLYITNAPLSLSERTKIKTHPLIGYQILQKADFSNAVLGGVLQHHETEIGTGYPQGLKGENISLYARIIAVACSFEAITSEREYREAKSSYEAMIEMMRNENKAFNPDIIMALIHSMSLFPIGAYVYLINGKIAQVVDVTPGAPRTPVVQLVREKGEDGKPIKIQTNEKDLKIMRVLNSKEVTDILGVMNK